jgi:uncharacterized protein (TIGR04255 family)
VCQLRFNPILVIGQEHPAEFQEQVRREYPLFSEETGTGIRIGPGASVETIPPQFEVWRFKTEDGCWVIGLGVGFLSLESTSYEHFDDFQARFQLAKQALERVYGIDHYTRVGLRYVNIFSPDDFPGDWREKFNPKLLGVMADEAIGRHVVLSRHTFQVAEGDWTIVVRHGTENGSYRLDIDHALEARVASRDIDERLRQFNKRVYQIFRWAISDKTVEEMEAVSE